MAFFEGNRLVAVLDLILNYPNTETAFIGFFMLEKRVQGKGLGTNIVSEIIRHLWECGYQYTRLGYVKGNPQSRAFWRKNGFLETGIETQTEAYTIVLMQRENFDGIEQ